MSHLQRTLSMLWSRLRRSGIIVYSITEGISTWYGKPNKQTAYDQRNQTKSQWNWLGVGATEIRTDNTNMDERASMVVPGGVEDSCGKHKSRRSSNPPMTKNTNSPVLESKSTRLETIQPNHKRILLPIQDRSKLFTNQHYDREGKVSREKV